MNEIERQIKEGREKLIDELKTLSNRDFHIAYMYGHKALVIMLRLELAFLKVKAMLTGK